MSSKPRQRRKANKRLAVRLADFAKGPQGHDRTVQQWEDGGFHKPGSNKK